MLHYNQPHSSNLLHKSSNIYSSLSGTVPLSFLIPGPRSAGGLVLSSLSCYVLDFLLYSKFNKSMLFFYLSVISPTGPILAWRPTAPSHPLYKCIQECTKCSTSTSLDVIFFLLKFLIMFDAHYLELFLGQFSRSFLYFLLTAQTTSFSKLCLSIRFSLCQL